ncbi:MAG TPA: M56 family metallopeptidase, partial [Bryobacteraceae bacterium]|nr:M56 family metallopeptidase [Bryobacteraceae bacterium]
NHLWESSLFAAAVAALTLVLQKNPARVRHWLWLAASIKFLIPFSLLVSLGSQVKWRTGAPPPLSTAVRMVGQHFSAPEVKFASSAPQSIPWAAIGGAVWLAGCAAVLLIWCLRWWRVRSVVREALPLWRSAGIEARLSRGQLEPGVFGIWRPVLLLPAGIMERLTADQLDAIVAHELCHVRRRDNLAASIHMVVEALFWFHPLVWWIGARMMEERERACDEEVLRSGKEPEVYAESILKICRFYLESPVECVAGVTGSDLKTRIEGIMAARIGRELDFARKMLLAAAGMAAIAGPILVGIWNAPPLRAQTEKRLAFEVASVKPTKTMRFEMEFAPSGRFTARGVPLLLLVSTAYNVPFQGPRLSGLDPETAEQSYDIEATAESGAIPAGASKLVREAKMKLMLQSLLEDRFKMKIRRETKVVPVYAVVVGKSGPKLTKAKIEEKDCPEGVTPQRGQCHQFAGGLGRGLHGDAVSMEDLALAVSNWADRPVIDRTGLEGLYEINTEGWTRMVPRGPGGNEAEEKQLSDPTRPTIYMIFERLGLKMESSKAPIETIVVEHVEKPTEN